MLPFLTAMLQRIKYNLSRNGINTSAVSKRIFFIQRKTEQSLLCSDVVRVAGLEPVQSCLHKNLNLARLPVSPHPHIFRFYAEIFLIYNAYILQNSKTFSRLSEKSNFLSGIFQSSHFSKTPFLFTIR